MGGDEDTLLSAEAVKRLKALQINIILNVFQLLGAPQDSGISLETVLELGPSMPLFGVCMGLQCIGEAFGGTFYIGIISK